MRSLIPKWVEDYFRSFMDPVTDAFGRMNLNPNWLTTAGLALGIVAAILLASGLFVLAGGAILLAGIFDTIDGRLARRSNRVTSFGALYDSTLDRYSEAVIFFGLGFYYAESEFHAASIATVFAAGGAIMTSYVRARAEALGFQCNIGFMRRQERVVLLGFGALLTFTHPLFVEFFNWCLNGAGVDLPLRYPPMPLTISVFLIAVLANVTAAQRLRYVWKQFRAQQATPKPESSGGGLRLSPPEAEEK